MSGSVNARLNRTLPFRGLETTMKSPVEPYAVGIEKLDNYKKYITVVVNY